MRDIKTDMTTESYQLNIMNWSTSFLSDDGFSNINRLDVQFPVTPDLSPADQATTPSPRNANMADSFQLLASLGYQSTSPGKHLQNMLESETDTFLSTSSPPPSVGPDPSDCESILSMEKKVKVKKEKKERKNPGQKKQAIALQFPPCLVCGGKSSGYHFGVTTCEACKAFFRRYLLRNDVGKCRKGGACKLSNKSRGNCSGCRLKRCLDVGMAKEKSKLGRYSVSKRTETIELMNKMSGKEDNEESDFKGVKEEVPEMVDKPVMNEVKAGKSIVLETDLSVTASAMTENSPVATGSYDPDCEMIGRKLKYSPLAVESEQEISERCVDTLIDMMHRVLPFGRNIVTDEDVQAALLFYHEKHLLSVNLFGERKPVSKEEHELFYKKYGIDLDCRYEMIRSCHNEIELLMERYCNFAKRIPGFVKLTYHDQANLLKAYRCDFFTIIGCAGYHEEYNILLYNGSGFHLSEVGGTIFSTALVDKLKDAYLCLQRLHLTNREKAIILSMVLTSQDRGRLDNRREVEVIQEAFTKLLWKELQFTYGEDACRRYSKIIEALSKLRDFTEIHTQEYKEVCKDEINLEEAPLLTEFLLEY